MAAALRARDVHAERFTDHRQKPTEHRVPDGASHLVLQVFATGPSGELIAVGSTRIMRIATLSRLDVSVRIDTSGLAPGQYTPTV